MAEKYHDDWEVVPFNLNMEPVEDPDARALVPANTERQLEAMPLHQRSSANPTMLNHFLPHRHNPYSSQDHHPRRRPLSRCQPAQGSFHLDPMRESLESRPTGAARSAAYATLRRRKGLTLKGLEQPKSVSSLQRQPRSTLSMLLRHLPSVARL